MRMGPHLHNKPTHILLQTCPVLCFGIEKYTACICYCRALLICVYAAELHFRGEVVVAQHLMLEGVGGCLCVFVGMICVCVFEYTSM